MKRFTSMLVLVFVMSATFVLAQTRQLAGTVRSADDNMPVAGATVIVTGTSTGAVTDENGNYVIKNVNGAVSLTVNFFGFEPAVAEVSPSATTQDFLLSADALNVQEVVVTGMGLTREKKALGYAVQEVDGEELAKVRTGNVVTSMSGRVAGVQITSASGQLGGGSRINIRGNTSLTGNNQPLFVVDGVPISNEDYSDNSYNQGNLAADIPADDIESMSVLKGASATAIYGSRGANGVVLITTKKGKQGSKTFGVSVNSSVALDKVSTVPVYQQVYGGGSGGTFETITIDGKSYNYPNMDVDESWGPKFDESVMHLTWNSFDEWDTENYMVEKPWIYPENDYTTYYKTGVTLTNNIQVTGSDQNYSYRLSYTNSNQTGTTENSESKSNTVSFNVTSKMNDYLDSWASGSYVSTQTLGRAQVGYSGGTLYQWIHTELDYSDLRDYQNPDGTQRTWNRNSWDDSSAAFADNPFWNLYKNYQSDSRNRFFGNGGVNINPFDGFKITGRVGVDTYTNQAEYRTASGGSGTSSYELVNRTYTEINMDLYASYNKRFADDLLGVSAMIGTNSNDRKYGYSGGYTNSGLIVPDFFQLSNSTVTATTYDNKNWRRINAVYGNFTVDYNQIVYLDVTARNDWSSTLPAANRSYFYPSANLSLILSELGSLKDISWLDFAKVRGGYAVVGNDADPYNTTDYMSINTAFGSDVMFSIPTTLSNSDLLPEKTKSWEVGLEAQFLNRRLGFDLAYYQKRTINQIIPATVSQATGYAYQYINAGELYNSGVELTINATPVQTKSGFRWDAQFNVATLNTEVVEINDDIQTVSLSSSFFSVSSLAVVGQSYPMLYGVNYVYGENGEKLIDPETGLYQTSSSEAIAKVTPDFTAGFSSSFSYKGFDLSFLLDMQMGGHIYYGSYRYGLGSGILYESALPTNVPGRTGNMRDEESGEGATGGWICEGVYGNADGEYVDASGNTSSTAVKNETIIAGMDYANFHESCDAIDIFKSDYLKLREVRLGYTVPSKLTGPIKDVRLSAYGRNLATWMTDQDNFDPEYIQSASANGQGIEGGYAPTTRTFGFSIGFNF
ncbi:MAG: SusC/RagA family TonB-linked outer membrane protein [Rikenellaceae bacterium]